MGVPGSDPVHMSNQWTKLRFNGQNSELPRTSPPFLLLLLSSPPPFQSAGTSTPRVAEACLEGQVIWCLLVPAPAWSPPSELQSDNLSHTPTGSSNRLGQA